MKDALGLGEWGEISDQVSGLIKKLILLLLCLFLVGALFSFEPSVESWTLLIVPPIVIVFVLFIYQGII
jgi:nitrate/nitrite transporter NarK